MDATLITIATKEFHAEVKLETTITKIQTSNDQLHQSLTRLFEIFYKKGVEALMSSHGTTGKRITLERKIIKSDDPNFLPAVLKYLQRLFGTNNVSTGDTEREKTELRNQVRRVVNKHRSDGSVRSVIPAINAGVEKLSVEQLRELAKDLE